MWTISHSKDKDARPGFRISGATLPLPPATKAAEAPQEGAQGAEGLEEKTEEKNDVAESPSESPLEPVPVTGEPAPWNGFFRETDQVVNGKPVFHFDGQARSDGTSGKAEKKEGAKGGEGEGEGLGEGKGEGKRSAGAKDHFAIHFAKDGRWTLSTVTTGPGPTPGAGAGDGRGGGPAQADGSPAHAADASH